MYINKIIYIYIIGKKTNLEALLTNINKKLSLAGEITGDFHGLLYNFVRLYF